MGSVKERGQGSSGVAVLHVSVNCFKELGHLSCGVAVLHVSVN